MFMSICVSLINRTKIQIVLIQNNSLFQIKTWLHLSNAIFQQLIFGAACITQPCTSGIEPQKSHFSGKPLYFLLWAIAPRQGSLAGNPVRSLPRPPQRKKTTENGLHQTRTKPQNPRREGAATNARIFLVKTGCAGAGTNERIHRAAPCARVLRPFRAGRLDLDLGD
jgi:hypothetical protein